MKAIIEEGTEEIGQKMQLLALAEGALPKHLLTALFTKSTDGRLLTHCQLSRHLVGLWVTGNEAAMHLLKRILVSLADGEQIVKCHFDTVGYGREIFQIRILLLNAFILKLIQFSARWTTALLNV